MVDDLLPPDFNKKGKKKKRIEEEPIGTPAEKDVFEPSTDEVKPDELPDLGGGDIEDYFELPTQDKVKEKKKPSAKKASKKAAAKPEDEWAETPEETPSEAKDVSAQEVGPGASEWEFGESEVPDTSGAADEFTFDESEASSEGVKSQETYDFGEPEWGTGEETVSETPVKPEDEWAEAPEFTSSFSEGYEETEQSEDMAATEVMAGDDSDSDDIGMAAEEEIQYPIEDQEEPTLANVDESKLPEQPLSALEGAKPPFSQTKQGKIAMIAAVIVLVLIVLSIPAYLFLAPSSEQATESTTSTTQAESSTSTTLSPVPEGSGGVETTITTVPILIEEATPDVTTPALIEFRDPFEPLKEATAEATTFGVPTDPSVKVVVLNRVAVEDGTEYAYVTYNGAGYRVQEGERIGVSPYQVKAIGADYTVFYFGDDIVAIRVGEGIAK